MRYGEKAIKTAGLELWDNPCPEKDYEINVDDQLALMKINNFADKTTTNNQL